MNIFDKPITKILEYIKEETILPLSTKVLPLQPAEKNPFLMERDTQLELGGFPKDSINIYVPSSNMQSLKNQILGQTQKLEAGVYCIGNPELSGSKENHISFGKIVLLETETLPDEQWYNFTQSELITDSKIYLKDIMLRQSSTHYNTNLRVSKNAMKNGFTLEALGKAYLSAFEKIECVKSATIILIIGDSYLYKNLLETAEKIKEITLALNHIFDGIDMDCGHCNLVEICNEVEGMRKLHKKRS